MIDFYTQYILPELQSVCAPLTVIQEVGYPVAINSSLLLNHLFDGITNDRQGQLTFLRYTTIHRLSMQWQDFSQAERRLVSTANALYQRLVARSTSPLTLPPSDAVVGEAFQVQPLTTGFITVAAKTYRVADVRTVIGVKLSSTYWSSL